MTHCMLATVPRQELIHEFQRIFSCFLAVGVSMMESIQKQVAASFSNTGVGEFEEMLDNLGAK